MRITKLQLNALWATSFLFILALASMASLVYLAKHGLVSDVVISALGLKTGGYAYGIVRIAQTFAGAPEGNGNGKE